MSVKSVCILLQNPYDIDVRVRRKAEALVEAGYSVDVLALRGSRTEKNYTLNGVTVFTVALGKKRGGLARYFFEYIAFFCWALASLSFRMLRRHYAVIDVNTLPDFLVFAGAPARWMGAKLVLDMHEITPEFYISKYEISENSWMVRFMKIVEKLSFDFADHVITIHEPIRDLLVSRGLCRAKSTVIMNAVDEVSFTSRSKSSVGTPVTKRLGAFVMMYHGTLTRIYGLELAIEALGIAHSEMPGAEFWILGDGPEKRTLERLAQECGVASKVKLLGSVMPTDVSAWLEQCDVGVLPMRRDAFLEFSFPNKLSEYIICGKCVIVPRLKAIQYYFSDEALAYFEPGSSASLAKQMINMYRDSAQRSQFAVHAKRQFEPIRWDVMKARYLALIEEMARVAGMGTSEASHAAGRPLSR